VIQHVEDLQPELSVIPLLPVEVFEHGKIHVPESGVAENVPAHIAEGSGVGRSHDRVAVHEAARADVTGGARTATRSTYTRTSKDTHVVICTDGIRSSTLRPHRGFLASGIGRDGRIGIDSAGLSTKYGGAVNWTYCGTRGSWGYGVAEWNGREQIRENLRAFIDTGFTALHDVREYWDGGSLKVFRGVVTMTPDDKSKPVVTPVMTHFFYMDERDPSKVKSWFGSVGPTQF